MALSPRPPVGGTPSPTDRLTAAYNLFVLCYVVAAVLLLGRPLSGTPFHLAFNGSVVLLALLLPRFRERGGLPAFLSLWYPVLLYTFFYYQSGLLNRLAVPVFLDPWFLAADEALFGEFPGYTLHRWLGGRAANELLHAAYFSYYLLIPSAGLLVYLKRREHFARYVFEVSALFYACYAVFIVLPVEGPLNLRPLLFDGTGFFERIVDLIYAKGENPGGAFPSSHVAVAALVARWWGVHFPAHRPFVYGMVSLLCVATVYGSFHYAVDVAAGLLMAWGANRLLAGGRGGD